MKITIHQLRQIIKEELEDTVSFETLLNKYVRDSRTINFAERQQMLSFIHGSKLPRPMKLERVEGKSLDWQVGDVIEFPVASFTSVSVSSGKNAGQIGWKSADKALTVIENATRGYKVDYDKVKVMFDAFEEREVLVYGSYRVAEIRKITEPGTAPQYGYTVPQYVLVEA